MYKVFKVGDKWQIFWCPSAPTHYADKVPYSDKLYTKRSAAYRYAKKLSDKLKDKPESVIKKIA